jgi:hypothetical protein
MSHMLASIGGLPFREAEGCTARKDMSSETSCKRAIRDNYPLGALKSFQYYQHWLMV